MTEKFTSSHLPSDMSAKMLYFLLLTGSNTSSIRRAKIGKKQTKCLNCHYNKCFSLVSYEINFVGQDQRFKYEVE